jgi:non-canonical purine NTP pyrophosphatase (RdgB/HAM1 family)
MIQFITGNAGKLRDIKAIIPGVTQLKIDLDEIQSLDPKEVIEHKLDQAALHHKGAFIVEDTSLLLTCLGGLPGTLVKWFQDSIGVDGIAALAMKYEDRSVIARVTIGYRDLSGDKHYFTGELHGDIVPPRGDLDFGWGPIFQPTGHSRTLGEMTVDEKNRISHRGIATRKLAAHLQQHPPV